MTPTFKTAPVLAEVASGAVNLVVGTHAVAEKGSLTHAGDVLHLSQSAVSRQIRALEESLAVTLFHRHARREQDTFWRDASGLRLAPQVLLGPGVAFQQPEHAARDPARVHQHRCAAPGHRRRAGPVRPVPVSRRLVHPAALGHRRRRAHDPGRDYDRRRRRRG